MTHANESVYLHRLEVDSRGVRRALTEFLQEMETSVMEAVEMVEEQRVLQAAVRVGAARLRRSRLELLRLEQAKMATAARLAVLQDRHRASELVRKQTEDAHALLVELEALRAASRPGQPVEASDDTSTIPAALASFESCVSAQPFLAVAVESLRRLHR